MKERTRVLIAGIGGASLGTEIFKCLNLMHEKYEIYGSDISQFAFGHYQKGFKKTFTIDMNNYIQSTIKICKDFSIDCIIPGGEGPLELIANNLPLFYTDSIKVAINSPEIIKKFTNKYTTFQELKKNGFVIPCTINYENEDDIIDMSYPCIVKPAVGSGGSSFVFFAENRQEALLYASYLKNNRKKVVIQEYISENEGEFTVGVLSMPNKEIYGSIALKRLFNSKLSVLMKSKSGLISSGYSQGLIDDFSSIRGQAEKIAASFESTGPLNIQGRLKNGYLVPFEINPRFSASTYLRALAGFNEIDVYIDFIMRNESDIFPKIKYGYYLRSLSETYIAEKELKND